MSSKRAPGHSLDEWMELVIQCRQSGLTDAAWCNEHGISTGSLPAVFIMRSHVCVKRPVRSQNRLAKPVPLISHLINRMWSRSL